MKTKTLRWLAAMLLLVAAMVIPARGNAVTLTFIEGSYGFDSDGFDSDGFDKETADKLFDGDTDTKWCYFAPSASSPAYVVFRASAPCRLNGYTITTANDNATENKRNPKKWNIYGSNDQSTWTKLVSVSNDDKLQDENCTAYEYTLNVGIATQYEYYKWEITANQGADVFQVSEFSISVSNCTDASHEVALTLVKQKEATCTKDGYTQDFYRCSSCGRCYSDEAGKTEIDLASVTIPARHKFDGENGDCSVCGISHMYSYAGTAADPFQISTADDLYWFSAWVNGTYTPEEGETAETHPNACAVLTNDITVNTGVLNADGKLASDVSGFTAWTPIGNFSNTYIGLFDGQNHTVSGLYFNDAQTNHVGLFGYVDENGKISNVGVVDSYLKGDSYIGGVCGYNNHGAISKCYNTGAVSGNNRIGGVCGYCGHGTISNCYNMGAVSGNLSGNYYFVGGVCGYSLSSTISNCYNAGLVSGSSDVGGVCGKNDNGTITNCYFDSTVYSGNAVGTNGGTASSNVLGKTSEQFKSGEVAYLLSQGRTVGEVTYDGSVWGQTLSGTGKQDYPVLGGLPVYYRDAVYTNTYGILAVGTQTITASNNPITWYEFTPTETGSYQFSSTQLTAGNLYVNTTKTESDYKDITTSPTYDLDAAITYYVAVNYTPGSYDLTITRLNNTSTAMEAVTASQIYAANGRIVCEGEFRIYDLLGRDVTRLNGSLQGVYVVITADAAQTVIVK